MTTTTTDARQAADAFAAREVAGAATVGDAIDLDTHWAFDWGIDGEPFLDDTPPIWVDKETGEAAFRPADEDPLTAAAAAPEAPPADAPAGLPLHGVLAPEGIRTGDGRAFSEGSMRWRDLPLPLMVQNETAMGHDGAIRVARIDTITRDESGPFPKMRFTGTWAVGEDGELTEAAAAAREEVLAGVLRGVSVDLDDVTVELLDAETGEPVDDEDLDFFGPMPLVNVVDGRISGATMCSIPAFQQAYVADGVFTPGASEPGDADFEPVTSAVTVTMAGMMPDGETPCSCEEDDDDFDPECQCEGEEVTAGAMLHLVAAATPPVYSAADFEDPGLTGPTALTVTDDGRVFGHLATWGTCHIGFDGVCVTPPNSHAAYAYFTTGSVQTQDGPVPVGQITMATGHAAPNLAARPAAAHYDNTGTVVADIAVGEDGTGIWYAGRLRPGVTEEQVTALTHGGALSGDWRRIGGHLELVAALAVNVPGFPVPRVALAASAGEQTSLVAAGVVGPTVMAARVGYPDAGEVARIVLAALDRRARVAALTASIAIPREQRIARAVRTIEGK